MNVVVVMPTLGRPTLTSTVISVVDQLEDDDRLVVVCDTINGNPVCARAIVSDFQPANIDYLECGVPGSRFGNAQRDRGLAFATGRSTHLAFLDDDDAWTFGAIDRIRERVSDDESHAHVFRADWGPGHHWHGTLWTEREFRVGNVGTPMLVVPNRPYVRSWMDGNGLGVVSDFGWMSAAVGELDGVCWWEDVVAVVRPYSTLMARTRRIRAACCAARRRRPVSPSQASA